MTGLNMMYEPRCPICESGGERIPPLDIKIEGSRVSDFMFLSPDLLVTDRVKKVFEQHHVSGVEFLDITLSGDVLAERLWHLHVKGRCKVSEECNVILLSQCQECGRKEYSTWDDGLRLDKTSYDGSDILRIEEHWGHIFVNEKVKGLIEQHALSNVRFTVDKDVIDTLSWMRPRI
jgi:hypothetical protein